MIYSEAESRVIVAAREGSIAYFHNDEPVRADLIRRLMLGLEMEDGQRVPAPCGIQIVGAVIHGQLDISNGRGAHGNTLPGLMLDACQIADGIDISFAQMGKLSLEKSAVSALWAVRSVIRGELIANDIRPATAGPCYLRLHGLHVDGDVQVRRAELQEPEGDDEFGSRQFALDLRNAVVMGNVYVRETVCNGTINISLARIGGIFTASGASITPLIAGGDAIQADGVSIGGALSLRRAISGKPMQANGRISFARSRLGATILDGAHINGVSRIAWGLDFEESAIDGALFLRDGFTTDGAINLKGVVVKSGIEAPEATFDMGLCGVELTTEGGVDFSRVVTADAWIDLTDARIAGILKTGDAEAHLNLRRASVESYDDLGQCWRPESLLLDGFQYGRLEHPTDRGGKTAIYRRRLKWLSRQGTGYSYQSNRWLSVLYSITGSPRIYVEKSRYRPQPFTQLSSVLDAQGFDNDARKVLIAKEWMEARQQRIWPVRWALMLYGVICGFGFSPQRLSFVILVYFLAGWNVIQWCKEHQLLIYDPLPVAAFTDSQHRPVMPFASVNSEATSPSCKDVDALYYTLNMMSPIDLKLSQNCLISEDLSFTLYDLRPKPLRRLWAFLGQARTGAPDVRQSFLRIRVFELGRWLNFIYPLLGKALVYMYFVLFISRLLRRKSPAAD